MDINKDFDKVKEIKKKDKNKFINFLLLVVILSNICSITATIIFDNNIDIIANVISLVLLFCFSILFTFICISNRIRNKVILFISAIILILFNTFNILLATNIINIPAFNKVLDFENENLTEVVAWASKNNVAIEQVYEYSDMIEEYHIIGQDIKEGTSINDVKTLTIAVSSGPNPDKEILVPNMLTWSDERVIDYVLENHLNNVGVTFIKDAKAKDTVIEQNASGNMKRSDPLELTFSLGEDEFVETKLINLIDKTEFEVMFYMKKHGLKYKFEKDFFNNTDRGLVGKQSIKSGTMVKPNDEEIIVTLSKGKEIKLPDFEKMDLEEITNYIITNRLKLTFSYKYDDSIKENNFISANYEFGDIVEEGTIISFVLSKGKLKMPEFSNIDDFYDWANENNVKYEEKNEFNNDVKQGEIIKISHNIGDVIKNGDVIIITISDGKEISVPNVVGLSKANATSSIEKAGLKAAYTYAFSSTVKEGNIISQSISSGSKVSGDTSITLTVSSGKYTASSSNSNKQTSSSSSSSNNSNSGSSNNNSSGSTTPTCDRTKTTTVYFPVGNTGAQVKSMIQSYYGSIKWAFNLVDSCSNGSTNSGSVCNGADMVVNYCDTYTVTIVK